MKGRTRIGGLALAALLVAALSFSGDGNLSPRATSAPSEPELVLFLAASAAAPFSDLSPIHHPVSLIPGESGGNVRIVYDEEIGRDVYSFDQGGWLEIPDLHHLFTVTGTDELTIEMCVKALDPANEVFYCGEQALPILTPTPDQVFLHKGDFSGNRNFGLNFAWGRDDMRPEYCADFGYFPGYGFSMGQTTDGFCSPPNPNLVPGWKVLSIRVTREIFDVPWTPEIDHVAWCYTNRCGNPYPAAFIPANLDLYAAMAADDPLLIGNGRPTTGTNPFVANPFKGKIAYVRVYRGLLSEGELNDNPANLPDLPPSNRAPVAVCKDLTIEADANCQAQINAAILDAGSYDPDGDALNLSIDNMGPLSAGASGKQTYTLTLTATEAASEGLSSSCQAQVMVIDVTAPVPGVSDPVCAPDGKGRSANLLRALAADACGGTGTASFSDVVVFNNGGQPVQGKGVFSLLGDTLTVYPSGAGWIVAATITATDGRGNTRSETFRKPLIKCR